MTGFLLTEPPIFKNILWRQGLRLVKLTESVVCSGPPAMMMDPGQRRFRAAIQ